MGLPASSEARRFYRCSLQRHEEATVLLDAGYTTGAVYLAGYGIECILKALLLDSVPASQRDEVVQSFRGNRAHDYEWLRIQYVMNGGGRIPREIVRHLLLANDWSTDLRYAPHTMPPGEAHAFFEATAAVMNWANARL